jgi:2-amino-4-hydroxy-6-hydroxymethyldihydropteridine diphosphokinase
MSEALLLLGSNYERIKNMSAAIEILHRRAEVTVLGVSDFYESDDVGGQSAAFLNAAVWIKTELSPACLRMLLRRIEAQMGRVRRGDSVSPLPIDLDISLYDDITLSLESTTIPDPGICRYPHVAVPLAQLCPEWQHPEIGKTLTEIANAMDCQQLRCLSPVHTTSSRHIGQNHDFKSS